MNLKHLELPQRILKDKRIKPEGKLIYSYIFTKGFERIVTHINVGELQQLLKISNQGLRKNLEKLEFCKYLIYKEYETGMYMINVLT